ncbi:MAG: replication initiation protein [Nitrospirae bacterium]|nr:replication initiation protein [Nitrospirota bacterium]
MNKKDLVTKANEINEAHYRLSVYEQKLLLTMISMIEPSDEDFKEYKIKISDFAKLLDIDVKHGNVYEKVKYVANELRKRELNLYDSETDSYLNVGWLSSSKYFFGKGYVELEFSPKLKPYLLGLKESFLSYRLRNVIQLKSAYSIRIYELLKQYERIGKRVFKIDSLKKILGLKEDEYPLYANFKQKVLSVAQKELKANTDISFEIKEIKTIRRVTEIEFLIIKNEKVIRDGKQVLVESIEKAIFKLEDYEKNLFDKLQKYYQLSREQAHEIVTLVLPQKGKEYVEGLLNYCSGYYEKKRKENMIVHLGAITWKGFQEGWQPQQSLFDIESKERGQAELKRQAENKLKEKAKQEERLRIRNQVDGFINNLTPEGKTSIEQEFPEWLKIKNPYTYKHSYQPDMDFDSMAAKMRIDLHYFIEETLGLDIAPELQDS